MNFWEILVDLGAYRRRQISLDQLFFNPVVLTIVFLVLTPVAMVISGKIEVNELLGAYTGLIKGVGLWVAISTVAMLFTLCLAYIISRGEKTVNN
ncbi:MAG: hypothetical protein Q7S34_01490 [bacterium]|nr:hypothetical protein [bacterium]